MSIPLPTTTISLLAPKNDGDTEAEDWGVGADPETGFEVVASGIRAHFNSRINVATPSAFGQFTSGGNTEQLKYRLITDPCDIRADMRVMDESTGIEYDVAWVMQRPAPMQHTIASVTHSTGTP